ncbi:hypothetical protein NKG94_09420 [Micromonospora sp. M12]
MTTRGGSPSTPGAVRELPACGGGGAKQEAERAVAEYRSAAGSSFDDTVATREALRIFGEMMVSHMQAAARHLDDGSEQLARTMDRIAAETPGRRSWVVVGQSALPRHQQR